MFGLGGWTSFTDGTDEMSSKPPVEGVFFAAFTPSAYEAQKATAALNKVLDSPPEGT